MWSTCSLENALCSFDRFHISNPLKLRSVREKCESGPTRACSCSPWSGPCPRVSLPWSTLAQSTAESAVLAQGSRRPQPSPKAKWPRPKSQQLCWCPAKCHDCAHRPAYWNRQEAQSSSTKPLPQTRAHTTLLMDCLVVWPLGSQPQGWAREHGQGHPALPAHKPPRHSRRKTLSSDLNMGHHGHHRKQSTWLRIVCDAKCVAFLAQVQMLSRICGFFCSSALPDRLSADVHIHTLALPLGLPVPAAEAGGQGPWILKSLFFSRSKLSLPGVGQGGYLKALALLTQLTLACSAACPSSRALGCLSHLPTAGQCVCFPPLSQDEAQSKNPRRGGEAVAY